MSGTNLSRLLFFAINLLFTLVILLEGARVERELVRRPFNLNISPTPLRVQVANM
jgi:hypothetical protein